MKTKVVKRGKEYCVEFSHGVQGFRLDYFADKKSCQWMKKNLDMALQSYKHEIARDIFKKMSAYTEIPDRMPEENF